MAGKYVRIQNTSRGTLILDLNMATRGKVITLKPNAKAAITSDEYEYLTSDCPNLFKNGDINTVSGNDEVEVVKSENVYSEEDIAKIIELNLTQFTKKIKGITSVDVLKDIRISADKEGKTDKFMKVIDNRIMELEPNVTLI